MSFISILFSNEVVKKLSVALFIFKKKTLKLQLRDNEILFDRFCSL